MRCEILDFRGLFGGGRWGALFFMRDVVRYVVYIDIGVLVVLLCEFVARMFWVEKGFRGSLVLEDGVFYFFRYRYLLEFFGFGCRV